MSPDGRRSAVRRTAALASVAALMATCAVNFVTAPTRMCLMDGGCTAGDGSFTSYGAYPRAVAVACFVSFGMLLLRRGTAAVAYRRAVAACELYAPAPAADRRRCAVLRAAYTALCAVIIVPVNLSRVYLLYVQQSPRELILFFVFMYMQNASVCLLETRFVALCYSVRNRFGQVNRDLERLAADGGGGGGGRAEAAATPRHVVTYARDFYSSSPSSSSSSSLSAASSSRPAVADAAVAARSWHGDSTANVVEIIRVRHRLVRDAVYALADLFGVPMGLSLSTLGVFSLFDIYYEVFAVAGVDTRTPVFVYMWLFQYSVRFYAIVVSAHQMTKQALKSKVLITDMNNRYLDSDTKEELQLCLSQISSCSIEFSAGDLFTINMHLITSAIAAGVTFLVILLQLDL